MRTWVIGDGASVRGSEKRADVGKSIVEDEMQFPMVSAEREHLHEVLLREAEREVEHCVVGQSRRVKHLAPNYYYTAAIRSPTLSKETAKNPPFHLLNKNIPI